MRNNAEVRAGLPENKQPEYGYEKHIPVMLSESVEALNIKPDGVYADLTLGRAGHSRAIAERLTGGRLICVDKDAEAIAAAEITLKDYAGVVTLIQGDFRDIRDRLAGIGISELDGILMDLGVSSPQLDDAMRGFSYMADAPLDMRMDRSSRLTAHTVVNEWGYDELKRILYEYGEERYAPQIAANILDSRPINTTLELVEVIKNAMPAKALREKQHPAKRSFQGIRIAVNDELGALEMALEDAGVLLAPGGRLAVITFHSLEDRIVKTYLTRQAKGCVCPPDFPVCVCGKTPNFRLITRKPVTPVDGEIADNPRSRSAKLRVGEKI